jgi:pyruvate ferredoxin oxidoreductase beta subunit
MERGHDMVYVCYDNGAYMNTGIQRSSATPKYADTTTSPAGSSVPGKQQYRKDLTKIMVAHGIPYVAQSAPLKNFKDLYEKSEKAIYTKGPAFLNVIAPCPRGWRYDTPKLMEMAEIAVDTCFWPLFEVENGVWKLTYKPKNKRPISDWLESQGRFKHIAKKPDVVNELQAEIDQRWADLLALCGEQA